MTHVWFVEQQPVEFNTQQRLIVEELDCRLGRLYVVGGCLFRRFLFLSGKQWSVSQKSVCVLVWVWLNVKLFPFIRPIGYHKEQDDFETNRNHRIYRVNPESAVAGRPADSYGVGSIVHLFNCTNMDLKRLLSMHIFHRICSRANATSGNIWNPICESRVCRAGGVLRVNESAGL